MAGQLENSHAGFRKGTGLMVPHLGLRWGEWLVHCVSRLMPRRVLRLLTLRYVAGTPSRCGRSASRATDNLGGLEICTYLCFIIGYLAHTCGH